MKIDFTHQWSIYTALCFVPITEDESSEVILSRLANENGLIKEFLSKKSIAKLHILIDQKFYVLIKVNASKSFSAITADFRKVIREVKDFPSGNWAIDLTTITDKAFTNVLARAWVHACVVSLQKIGKNKTTEELFHCLDSDKAHLQLVTPYADDIREDVLQQVVVANAQLNAMTLGNAPSNKKDINFLTAYCEVMARKAGLEIEIFDQDRLMVEGFKALLAVNRGSEQPARFILLKYNMSASDLPLVALVGKGVIFDTGGINLKPSDNLFLMKSDMCGAAAVLGAAEAIALNHRKIRLLAAIPLTDNAIDAKSTKPGDVIGSYNGKTIEVIDTDAEGRLCLADALSYISRNYSPDYIIDIATLTGSAARALGHHYAALFSPDENFQNILRTAGQITGEKLWPLPLDDDYKEDLHSDVADLANFSNKPTAGAISAALFLKEFVDDPNRWAHIDIAGTAFTSSEFGKQRNASGFGVQLLYQFVKTIESIY
ncbi:leucyl aminopeptidase family protein [Schleiferia thermophila]